MGIALWRLHLRPEKLDPREVVAYCLENGFMGLCWKGPDEIPGESRQNYLKRHKALWESKGSAARQLIRDVKEDDLIWARDAEGGYLLGHVTGAPYPRFGDRIELRDIYHVAPVEIIGGRGGACPILDTEVPGKIKARFSGQGLGLQRVHDWPALHYTSWLFAAKTGRPTPEFKAGHFIESLDPYELEDLVVLYLQEQGWRIILSSHSRTTPRYEATFVHPERGTAGVQVKQMGTGLDASAYASDAQVDRVILFAANGQYGENRPSNVDIIPESDLLDFAQSRRAMLPAPIRRWLDISIEGMSRAA